MNKIHKIINNSKLVQSDNIECNNHSFYLQGCFSWTKVTCKNCLKHKKELKQ